ncbi:hypothetical protein [Ursidibacter arcticus]
MGIKVLFGSKIASELQHFPEKDLIKILQFKEYVEIYGLENLPGRNKCSDNVPTDDPNWSMKVAKAQQYNLWHYHIGIPEYDVSLGFGNYTSEYILHYIRNDDSIQIVDFSAHPPFRLPSESYLQN